MPRPTAEQAQWPAYEIGVFYHYDMNALKPGWDHRKLAVYHTQAS